jgi:hypothetical protein
MKTAICELVASKKFLAVVIAMVVYVAGRLGFDVNLETLDRLYFALLVYVGAQGLADHGKEAARLYRGAGDGAWSAGGGAERDEIGPEPADDAGTRTASRRADTAPLRGLANRRDVTPRTSVDPTQTGGGGGGDGQ